MRSGGVIWISEQGFRFRGGRAAIFLLAIFLVVLAASFLGFSNMYKMHVVVQVKTERGEAQANDRYQIKFRRLGKPREKRVTASDGLVRFLLSANTEDFRVDGLSDNSISSIRINSKAITSFNDVPATLKEEKRKLRGKFLWFSTSIALATVLAVVATAALHRHRLALLNSQMILELRTFWHSPSLKTPWLVLLSVLFALNLFFNPCEYYGSDIDASWIWAINQISNSACIYGKDVVFTRGPLGYLFRPYGYGTHLYQAWALNAACVILLFGLFALYERNHPNSRERLGVFALVWLFFLVFDSMEWVFNFIMLFVAMLLWALQDKRWCFCGLSLLLSGLTSFALVTTFNSGMLGASMSGLLGVLFLLHNRTRLLAYLAIYAATVLALITAVVVFLFAGLTNFVDWLVLSVEVARGYNTAMRVSGNPFFILLALATVGIYARLANCARTQCARFFGLAILAAPYLFFAFKHGFVRQDVHMLIYFSAMPFALALLHLFSPLSLSDKARAAFIVSAVTGAAFVSFYRPSTWVEKSTVTSIWALARWQHTREDTLARMNQLYRQKDEWTDIIGRGSIQILPMRMIYAEINGWPGWRPNPVLQLYVAYTRRLDDFSARSFHGRNAPRFIMVEFDGLDDRNMFLDTPATWNSVMLNYSVVKHDLNKALLERKSGDVRPSFQHTSEAWYRFDETINIPESGYVYARIEFQPTVVGKLWTLLFRGSLPEVILSRQDGTEDRHRVVPETLGSPVLISHVPENLAQMLNLQMNNNADNFRVASAKFTRGESPFFFYKNKIKVEWLRLAKGTANAKRE
jgi:hypothetical protein